MFVLRDGYVCLIRFFCLENWFDYMNKLQILYLSLKIMVLETYFWYILFLLGLLKLSLFFYNTYKCTYGVQCFDTGIHCVIFKIQHPDVLKHWSFLYANIQNPFIYIFQINIHHHYLWLPCYTIAHLQLPRLSTAQYLFTSFSACCSPWSLLATVPLSAPMTSTF